MTVGTKRESFVQMDIGHWYQSSTASNRIWHVIYCWIYLWNLVEAEVFVLQKEKTQQVPNKLSWYVKHLPKFGNHSHFWRRCMKSVICLERELSCWIRFVNLKGADVIHFRWFRTQKNCDYTKHGSSANRKHHADSHIYICGHIICYNWNILYVNSYTVAPDTHFFFHSQTYTRTFSNLHTTDCVQQYIKQISSGGSEFCLFASFGLVYSGMLCHSMKWDTKKRHSRISIIISNNFSNAYHHWNCIEKCSWAWETVFESSVIGTHFYLIFVTVEMLLLFIASPDCWEFFYFLGR